MRRITMLWLGDQQGVSGEVEKASDINSTCIVLSIYRFWLVKIYDLVPNDNFNVKHLNTSYSQSNG